MEQACGVVNREDMNLTVNEPIHDAVGAADYFSNSGIIDLWHHTTGFRESRESFYGSNKALRYEQCVAGRISRNELSNRLDIIDCSTSPDQQGHLRS